MHLTKSLGLHAAENELRRGSISGCYRAQAVAGKRVLIADAHTGWRDLIACRFRTLGIEADQAESLDELRAIARITPPDIVVLELNFRDGTWFDALNALQQLAPNVRIVVVTGSGSIASAVEAVKCGVTGYLVKPVTAEEILKAADPEGSPRLGAPNEGMSLDRAIWEYLTQTVAACGTIAGAARVLGLDRRSLRRMLSKNPPAR
jgi:two-component system, response regulator RegA